MTPELTTRALDERTPRDAPSLEGATCVITGSSRGIGRAIATQLGHEGANVVVNYRSSASAAHEVVAEIEASKGSASAVQADVSEYDAVEAMADEIHDEFGAVDVLVNNAGITVDKQFERLSCADWNEVMQVNLGGAFHCTKAFYDDIRDATEGRLINVSSVIGQRGNYGQSNYAASKSGLFGFTRSMALELAPHGTTANCVAPGYTQTEMTEAVGDNIKDHIRDRIPLDRFATVEEVACAVCFLASPNASYVTGEVINVNGGMPA